MPARPRSRPSPSTRPSEGELVDRPRRARRAAASRPSAPTDGGNVFDAAISARARRWRPWQARHPRRLVRRLARAHRACAGRSRPEGTQLTGNHCAPPSTSALRHRGALAVWGFETGFETGELAVIGEQDILGRPPRAPAARRAPAAGFHRRADHARDAAISSSMSITASAASSACSRSRPPARRMTASRSTTPADAQALPAGREYRAALALWLGGYRGRRSIGSAVAAGRRARPS